jgi:hypothetical protein
MILQFCETDFQPHSPLLGTDANIFIHDADLATTTDPLDADCDDDGLKDGDEDINHNGYVDSG